MWPPVHAMYISSDLFGMHDRLLATFMDKNRAASAGFPMVWTTRGLHYHLILVLLLHLADLHGIRSGSSSSNAFSESNIVGYCVGTTLVNFLRGLQIVHVLRGFTLCPSVRRGLHGFVTRTLKRAVRFRKKLSGQCNLM
jgi:hypothetical protein